MSAPDGALAGVRVLDLSRLLPGPLCTWYLQGLGAGVTKVEEPRTGDYLRYFAPFTEAGDSTWFSAINAGKRSVALDLRSGPGRAALLALIEHSDVLVEGFRPGVMARLGLDPEHLRERFPRLIIASISGFGQDGPWRARPGHDLGYCALAGALSLAARDADGAPHVPGVQLADVAGGALTAAFAIAAALFQRERTGAGDWLDLSMTDAVLPFMATALADAAQGEGPGPGEGLLTGGSPLYAVYACQDDRLLAFAPIEPQFQAEARAVLAEVVGAPVELEREALRAAFRRLPRDAWVERLGQACVEPVLELAEVLAHPLHRARGTIRGEGARARVAPPLAGPRDFVLRPPPGLGEHTASALAEVGYDASALTADPA